MRFPAVEEPVGQRTIGTRGYAFVLRELSTNGVVVHIEPPYAEWELRCPDDRPLTDFFSDSMVEIILSPRMKNFYLACLISRTPPKCECLVCNVCDECQILPAGKGAPSMKKRCGSTPRCEGIMRRIRPDVFSVVVPKKKRRLRTGTVVTPIS